MANVAVYIIHTDDSRTERVMMMFKNDLFLINEIEIVPPTACPYKLENKDDSFEFYQFVKCLNDSKNKYPNSPVIVVKDSSITVSTPDTITEVILNSLKKDNWDIFYLSKYMDLCSQYNNYFDVPETSIKIVHTTSPYGTQALMFTPDMRDIIIGDSKMKDGRRFEVANSANLNLTLNRYIEDGKINAITTTPNLITPDPDSATDNIDYEKSNECRLPDEVVVVQKSNNTAFWIFVASVAVLLIIGLFFIYKRNSSGAMPELAQKGELSLGGDSFRKALLEPKN